MNLQCKLRKTNYNLFKSSLLPYIHTIIPIISILKTSKMQLTKYFFKKLHDEIKIIDLLTTKPKTRVRLDPIDPEDLHVDLQVVEKWSRNNSQLLHLIMQNGMATFICNYDFIHEHYEQLIFIDRKISFIDLGTLNFKNLITLNLSENNIKKVQNLPSNLQQLYLDFNQVNEIKLTKSAHENLILLSISNNSLTNIHFEQIQKQFPNLRCLNVANNMICDIRNFVQVVKKFRKLKILTSYQNPISLLRIYFDYITENIELRVFDGQKYVKTQPPKKRVEQPKPQVKQQAKDEKKDPKKDAKKGSKQLQVAVQQKPKPQPVVQEKKKQLTEQDFITCSVSLNITNFQNFTGNMYDPSLFPADFPIEKTQTTYWLQYTLMGSCENLQGRRVRFDEVSVVQNQPNRLSFAMENTRKFVVSFQNKEKLQEGVLVGVYSEQPVIQVSQTGEQRLVKQGNEVVMRKCQVGEVFVDLRELVLKREKQVERVFRMWQPQLCSRPYFKNPLFNQGEQIVKRKEEFENKLRKEEEERMRRLEEEQGGRNQKKGGKDVKKAQKKAVKKEGKEVVGQKKLLQKSNYPVDSKIYCYLNENRLYKAKKETLAIRIYIQ